MEELFRNGPMKSVIKALPGWMPGRNYHRYEDDDNNVFDNMKYMSIPRLIEFGEVLRTRRNYDETQSHLEKYFFKYFIGKDEDELVKLDQVLRKAKINHDTIYSCYEHNHELLERAFNNLPITNEEVADLVKGDYKSLPDSMVVKYYSEKMLDCGPRILYTILLNLDQIDADPSVLIDKIVSYYGFYRTSWTYENLLPELREKKVKNIDISKLKEVSLQNVNDMVYFAFMMNILPTEDLAEYIKQKVSTGYSFLSISGTPSKEDIDKFIRTAYSNWKDSRQGCSYCNDW